jgi:hypothetical protein
MLKTPGLFQGLVICQKERMGKPEEQASTICLICGSVFKKTPNESFDKFNAFLTTKRFRADAQAGT